MELNIKPLLPYNPNIDEKTAMQESLKIWAWLKETGEDKDDHPDILILVEYEYLCPLCEAFRLRDIACEGCPLANGSLKCYENGQLFDKWEDALSDNDNPSGAAAAIYNKIFFEYKQRYNEEFNPYE